MDSRQPFRFRDWAFALALAAITFVAFLPVLRAGFTNFDDNDYVTSNPHVLGGLTTANVKWAWTATAPGYWQPLSWLSLMADTSLSGVGPAGYHRTNLIIHAISAAVVFLVLSRLTGTFWRAALVAALYAVHPLRVESVAWVAERKDVLSNLMAWLTIGGYVAYSRSPSARRYLLVLIPFVLGLLAKPMVVTLPCLLLLLDYWPLRRFKDRGAWRLLLEKAPLFLIALVAAGGALIAQGRCEALVGLSSYPLRFRIGTAFLGYGLYLRKMVWFNDLAVFYPLPMVWPTARVIAAIGCAILLAAITVVCAASREKRPWLIVGWLWFLGVMAPVSGIFQAGVQLLADRFSYLPSVGLLVMIVWSIPAMSGVIAIRRSQWLRGVAAVVVVGGLCAATWVQCGYWRDDRTLFDHALAVTDGNWMAHGQIGLCDYRAGDMRGAIAECKAALRIYPYDPVANFNLGVSLANSGKMEAAIVHYRAALEVRPDFYEDMNNLGVALQNRHDFVGAYEQYKHALQCDPNYQPAVSNMGGLLVQIGMPKAGVEQLQRAVMLDPRDKQARMKLEIGMSEVRRLAQTKTASAAADTGAATGPR